MPGLQAPACLICLVHLFAWSIDPGQTCEAVIGKVCNHPRKSCTHTENATTSIGKANAKFRGKKGSPTYPSLQFHKLIMIWLAGCVEGF